MTHYNFKSHEDIPKMLADYVVSVVTFSGIKINQLTDIKLSDINSFLNGLEEQGDK